MSYSRNQGPRNRVAEKVLIFDMLEMYLNCPHRFRREYILDEQSLGIETPEVQLARTVGWGVELAAQEPNQSVRDKVLANVVQELPVEQRLPAVVSCLELLERADKRADNGNTVRRQVQFSWKCKRNGWTYKAKVDLLETGRDERGAFIKIIDEKSASHVTSYHQRMVKFLTLVVSRSLKEEREAAKLRGEHVEVPRLIPVVRPLGKDTLGNAVPDKELFWSHRMEMDQMSEVERVVGLIETAYRNEKFRTKRSFKCDRCIFRQDCPEFAGEVPDNDVAMDAAAQLFAIVADHRQVELDEIPA